jgi:hypothetical protein
VLRFARAMRRETAILFVVLASGCSLLAPSDGEVLRRTRDATSGGAGSASGAPSAGTGAASSGTAGRGGSAGAHNPGGAGQAGTLGSGGEPGAEGGAAGTPEPPIEAGHGGEAASGSGTGGNGGVSGTSITGGSAGASTAGSGGESGTVPRAGLVLWLDAERVTTDSGQTSVSTWADQSGRGNDATQPTASARPRLVENGIGSRRSLSFDGASDFLMLPPGFEDFSAGVSFFAVAQLASEANCPPLLQLWNSHADAILFLRIQGRFQYEVGHDYASTTTATYSPGEPHTFGLVHGIDRLATLYFDGTAAGSHANMDLPAVVSRAENRIAVTGDTDGGGAQCVPFEGLIGEMLLYDRALPDSERRQVEVYLAAKWSDAP